MSQERFQKVEFTRAQLEFLDRQYPEPRPSKDATNREIRHQLSRRSVIHELRDRLQKQE